MDTYWPPGQSWPIRLEENNNTFVHSHKVSCGPISSLQKNKTTTRRKNNKLLKAQQTFFKKAKFFNRQCFFIQNFTHKTQGTTFFDRSCYFDICQQFHIRTSSQKCTVTTCNFFVFCLHHSF